MAMAYPPKIMLLKDFIKGVKNRKYTNNNGKGYFASAMTNLFDGPFDGPRVHFEKQCNLYLIGIGKTQS